MESGAEGRARKGTACRNWRKKGLDSTFFKRRVRSTVDEAGL